MKKITTTLTLFFLLSLSISVFSQSFSEDRSVEAYAEIDKNSTSITLKWKTTPHDVAYQIFRRDEGSQSWGVPKATLSGTDDEYIDNTVLLGKVYEYTIKKETTTTFGMDNTTVYGYSYLTASIEKPAVHKRGHFWVLIAQNIVNSLQPEIDRLVQDLAGDGWEVHTEVINPSATVQDIKTYINFVKSRVGCDAIYLLGHIPVPYSGLYCEDEQYAYPPDGHDSADANSHCGAWTADVYYGVTGGAWTDIDSTELAKRPENNNAAGDGKFDNQQIPGTVSMAVGRVDFFDLPSIAKTEIELTRQYLNKTHDYKMGEVAVLRKGIVENNFSGFNEGFSSGAIRDFTAICGKDAVVYQDAFTATASNDYLLSYVCGPGWYSSCGGFGETSDFNTKNMGAFNHLFGSFFGDYDNTDNLLRASLASSKLGYTVVWSGRPKWICHSTALGANYGDMAKLSQNNWLDYDGNYYQNGTHMALLGDPSMRHEMLKPVTNVSLVAHANNEGVDIAWDATTEVDIQGYYVYRSYSLNSNYVLLNKEPITTTSFIDTTPYEGINHYMVRVAKETVTGSGSYHNLSLGSFAQINGLKGQKVTSVNKIVNGLKVYPTLARNLLFVEQITNKSTSYFVSNNLGSVIKKGNLSGLVTQISLEDIQSGVYYLKINNKTAKFIKH